MEKSRQPTRKWWVTQTTASAALLVAWVNVGAWDKTVTIGLIGFASQAVTSYLTPNHDVLGGVPDRKPAKKRRPSLRHRGAALPVQRGALEDAVA
jgi:hypothetical protein